MSNKDFKCIWIFNWMRTSFIFTYPFYFRSWYFFSFFNWHTLSEKFWYHLSFSILLLIKNAIQCIRVYWHWCGFHLFIIQKWSILINHYKNRNFTQVCCMLYLYHSPIRRWQTKRRIECQNGTRKMDGNAKMPNASYYLFAALCNNTKSLLHIYNKSSI